MLREPVNQDPGDESSPPLPCNNDGDFTLQSLRAGDGDPARHIDAAQLWAAMLDPAGVKAELDSTRAQLQAARRLSDSLEVKVQRLRKKAIRLARMVATARHRASHDELTGLPTRRLLIDRCQQTLAQARRQHRQVGFMMLDVNGFKQVNDRYGHEAGDDLLKHIAQTLLTCTRRSDTVCRYGGDEFAIMLPELDSRERISSLALRIHRRLAEQFVLHGENITTAISVGVAVYPADGDSFRLLMKQADLSMYWSKAGNLPGGGPRGAAEHGR